jgi:hypothetical protein
LFASVPIYTAIFIDYQFGPSQYSPLNICVAISQTLNRISDTKQ